MSTAMLCLVYAGRPVRYEKVADPGLTSELFGFDFIADQYKDRTLLAAGERHLTSLNLNVHCTYFHSSCSISQ